MRLPLIAAATLLSLAASAPAAAQSAIAVPANAGWQHAPTQLILRSKLAGLPRGEIKDAGAALLDVSVQYGSTATTAVTFYIFRPAMMSVPVWFDRSETQIFKRDTFAGAVPLAAALAFAPPHTTAASSLRRIYTPAQAPFKSTGLAVLPLGDWLVAIRISSVELDPAQLDTKLSEVIAGLGWPQGAAESPAAVAVANCAAPLAYAKRAKLKKPDMTDALMGATLMGMADDKKADDGPPAIFCREGEPTVQYGTYRAVGHNDGYVMAIGDAGRTVSVGRGFALGGGDPGYMLSFSDLDQTLVYPSFDKLPEPAVALDAVMKNRPMSSSSRGGKKEITIGM